LSKPKSPKKSWRWLACRSFDEPDNPLLESAHVTGADYLVTGNTKHFPKTFETTAIVTPI
jgi:predicted nucleic acid-binding protein